MSLGIRHKIFSCQFFQVLIACNKKSTGFRCPEWLWAVASEPSEGATKGPREPVCISLVEVSNDVEHSALCGS